MEHAPLPDVDLPDPDAFTHSPPMRAVDEMIDRVASTDATVLVWGESGVGKELVARTIHLRSPRRGRPFVKVNCAALPLELLESELFGYERGAFTGAHRSKPGKFELANTGTIFLDEIGEMPPSLQAKLLHVLQDHEFARLGSRRDIRVDVRVVAATNHDLTALVRARTFRADLFYRLNVVDIPVPPLRERREEIPILVSRFLARAAVRYRRGRGTVSVETMERFLEFPWPGNVRQLENMVNRLVVLGNEIRVLEELAAWRDREDGTLGGHDGAPVEPAAPHRLPSSIAALDGVPLDDAVEVEGLREIARRAARDAERAALEHVLNRVRWNRLEASRRLKINYKTLLQKIRDLDIDTGRRRRGA